MDNLSIAKVLRVSTYILANVSFQPKENSTRYVLQLFSNFYVQSLEVWRYENFMQYFAKNNPFDIFNGLQETAEIILKDAQPTNNIEQIAKYSILISRICENGCELYDESKYEQLSDLIDLAHGLPEALLFKEVWNPKAFWKTYFNPYRKKWDKHFMKAEQKAVLLTKTSGTKDCR
jgi:hypothetical protein